MLRRMLRPHQYGVGQLKPTLLSQLAILCGAPSEQRPCDEKLLQHVVLWVTLLPLETPPPRNLFWPPSHSGHRRATRNPAVGDAASSCHGGSGAVREDGKYAQRVEEGSGEAVFPVLPGHKPVGIPVDSNPVSAWRDCVVQIVEDEAGKGCIRGDAV